MGKNDAFEYDVVWPRGKTTSGGQKLARRLDTLNGKVVAELWDWVLQGRHHVRSVREETEGTVS